MAGLQTYLHDDEASCQSAYSTNCIWYNALTNKESSNHRNHNSKGKLLLYLLLCVKLGQNDTIFETWDSCTSNTCKIANEPSLGSSIEVGSARFLNQSQVNISLRPIIQWPILPIIKIKSCSCESLLKGSLRNSRTFRPKSCGLPHFFEDLRKTVHFPPQREN